MKRIVCEECKKVYDYDRDEFCPRCGAFNPPVRTWGVDAQGNVVRVDGVSEQNHAGSFVHREVHREKAVRRALGMDWNKTRGARSAAPAAAAGVRPPGGEPEQDPALGGGHHRVFQLCPAPAGGAAGPALFVLIQNT